MTNTNDDIVSQDSQSDGESTLPMVGMAEFLENVPPGQKRKISDLFAEICQGVVRYIATPQILLHCDDALCNGLRAFRRVGDKPQFVLGREHAKDLFLNFVCSNCRNSVKTFSLTVSEGDSEAGFATKFGEIPQYGPPTPTRLLKLLESQREAFIKGRRCESQGLGIGAFAYYRRVTEHQRNRILDEIAKVSEKLGAPKESLDSIAAAKAETQFSKSISLVKNAIPQSLLIGGHNPLTLLHTALSAGLHEQSDERCLELAHDVRVVLVELSERISLALKDEKELNTAVSRLLKARD
jgi:hypothetical protein